MAPPRIAIVGRHGQLARALAEAGEAAGLHLIAAARPELDLARVETIAPVLTSLRPDAVVCAAAYTAVDKAESEPDLAYAINATGAGAVAARGSRDGRAGRECLDRLRFSRRQAEALCRG